MLCALSSIFSVLHSSAQKSSLLHEASLWLFKGNHKEGSWRRHKEVFPLLNLVVISVSLLGLPLVGCICILGLVLLFSCPVMSDSSRPHGLQHSRPLCPSPSPKVCPSPCPRYIHGLYLQLNQSFLKTKYMSGLSLYPPWHKHTCVQCIFIGITCPLYCPWNFF